jgi:XTP/dITP diphosphohydrolase
LRLIDDFEKTEAHFTSIIALFYKPLEKNLLFEGKVQGKISEIIRGIGGFGFDPIFLPNLAPDRTFAELTTEEKNKISHRGIAWSKFIKFLKEHN